MDQNPNFSTSVATLNVSQEEDTTSFVEYDFSDVVLNYINQMLMEEDFEKKNNMFQECSALQAAEIPFYEILGQRYPSSPNHTPEVHTDNFAHYNSSSNTNHCLIPPNAIEISCTADELISEYESFSPAWSFAIDRNFEATPQAYFNVSDGLNSVGGLVDKVQVHDVYLESEQIWNSRKGVEEANKFLPDDNNLIVNLERNGFFNDERRISMTGPRGKKNVHREDIEVEQGRSNKQLAVFSEEAVQKAMFDMVLLGDEGECDTSKNLKQNGQTTGHYGDKFRGKKQNAEMDVMDLRKLLIGCAQAIAADNRTTASELLKQIRLHSSPFGNGSQRLAHCFTDGLEARLAGTGSQIYTTLLHKKTSASDFLKGQHLFMAAIPFKKASTFFSNQTINDVAENASILHIVDFGILYGFQWPGLIQRLSKRKGGPPKLRITGIDFPQPGFRPAERVEETGRRLRDYAEEFSVPFEYHAIAQKWETIQLEDLKIYKDEILVVNCVYQARKLLDETVISDSPRSAVLNLVRRMNPNVFIHGVTNGAYSSPYFVTRFREALFRFSSMFDLVDTNVPREHPGRIIIERDLLGKAAFNVIACEGSERVERPETYKQWHLRTVRAGFMQLPLNKDILNKAKENVKSFYHKDFVVDEDSQWMLLGWKGRVIFALSSWRPM
ncbi:hypothetical protein MKW98_026388 [Papaver atlanticum]|uniref:Scarecrow-like protein 9 n=1 Tax=Papaver atlanticum TaxID=357466 RepID=A0AAD4SP12_9MAGN|nr:hypothetical protein MKW98_026388 [Papaver atlanticum]